MIAFQPWMTTLAVLIGNCGFWLFCFNRVNAWGLHRKLTKNLEKLVMLACFTIPCLVLLFNWTQITQWLWHTQGWWPHGAGLFNVWASGSLLSAAVLGPIWLESRRWIWPPPQLLDTQAQRYRVAQHIDGSSTANWSTALLDRIPGNEITQLEVNRKQLQLGRNLPAIDGLKIAHLSDLHFTGQLSLDHYHFVVDRVLELDADLIVITGDIIDYAKCLPWVEPILGRLAAPLGCTFLLGNHDQRIAELSELTDRLRRVGHHDLGVADQYLETAHGGHVFLTGNELPWFERHAAGNGSSNRKPHAFKPGAQRRSSTDCDKANSPLEPAPESALRQNALRLGLSHSPDNIGWAQQLQLDLLLAGHTHGGQVRIPGVGPLVAPSYYGSRFASGVFYRAPVLMHVSRGIAGTHPLRWRCLPEVSLLTLRTAIA